MAYIYIITNDLNNKVYIGQTSKTIDERFNGHISQSKEVTRNNLLKFSLLHVLMDEVGPSHFKIKILEEFKHWKRILNIAENFRRM